MVERILHKGEELALIIRRSFHKDGVEFFTPGSYSQQVGYMNRPDGYVIPPHVHNSVDRVVQYTKECGLIFTQINRNTLRVRS